MNIEGARAHFLTLFEPTDYITISGPAPNRGRYVMIQWLIENYSQLDFEFYSLNAHSGPLWPTDAGMLKYKNILLEFDKHEADKQIKLLKARKIPLTSLIHSGSKSVHAIISLEEACANREEYKQLTEAIYAAVDPSFASTRCRTGLDRKCRNAGRFTRLPEVIRSSTGLKQELIVHNGVVKEIDLETFFEFNKKRLDVYYGRKAELKRREEAKAHQRKFLAALEPSGYNFREVLHPNTVALLERGEVVEGSRHDALLYAGLDMYKKLYPIEEIEEALQAASIALGVDDRGDVPRIISWLETTAT